MTLILCVVVKGQPDKKVHKFPGGYGGEATPVPIPNTVVKLFHAFGTSDAGPRERR